MFGQIEFMVATMIFIIAVFSMLLIAQIVCGPEQPKWTVGLMHSAEVALIILFITGFI